MRVDDAVAPVPAIFGAFFQPDELCRIASTCAARISYVCSRSACPRIAIPILFDAGSPIVRRYPTTSAAEAAGRISSPGTKKLSIPVHQSVITHEAAPAASNTRVGGENPTRAMESRLMLRTILAEQFTRL